MPIDLEVFKKITKGDWRVRRLSTASPSDCFVEARTPGETYGQEIIGDDWYKTKEADCEAIAKLPELLSELIEAQEELRLFHDLHDRVQEAHGDALLELDAERAKSAKLAELLERCREFTIGGMLVLPNVLRTEIGSALREYRGEK